MNISHDCRETINFADKLVAKIAVICSTNLFCAFGISSVYQRERERERNKGKYIEVLKDA